MVIYFSTPFVFGFIGQMVVIPIFLAAIGTVIAFTLFSDANLTRHVVVYHRDSGGQVYQDHQKWWVEDAMRWADVFKLEHVGKRVLWIDGIKKGEPVPFNAWLAKPPAGEISADGKTLIPVTGTRVASVAAKMLAVGKIMKFREPTPGEKLQQGLMVAAIGIGVLGIVMAIGRIGEITGFGA